MLRDKHVIYTQSVAIFLATRGHESREIMATDSVGASDEISKHTVNFMPRRGSIASPLASLSILLTGFSHSVRDYLAVTGQVACRKGAKFASVRHPYSDCCASVTTLLPSTDTRAPFTSSPCSCVTCGLSQAGSYYDSSWLPGFDRRFEWQRQSQAQRVLGGCSTWYTN